MQQRINLATSNKYNKYFEYPNLIEAQKKSYEWFLNEHLRELFEEINPVVDNTGKLWILEFLDYRFGEVNRSVREAIRKGLSYDKSLYFNVRLTNKVSGEIKEQEIFIAELPIMTDRGSFIINGHERVVIHQVVRSEGILFTEGDKKAVRNKVYFAKLITSIGPWLTFEVNAHNVMSLKLAPKKPKILVTTLLRALGYSTNTEISNLFSDVDTSSESRYIESTLAKDPTHNNNEAVLEIYRKIRPDIAVNYENALLYINSLFFNPRKLFLGKTGRYKLNKKLGLNIPVEANNYVLTNMDIIAIIKRLIQVNNGEMDPDDVDSLSNRRVKSVGELMGDYLRIGVRRVEKIIKDRMSIMSSDEVLTPSMLVSAKPFVSVINEFFGSSSVSVFMDQDNILSEISNKRRVTAGGPGGLTKESATFSVRDVHYSQYSRLCPVESPEGPQIGIVNHLSVYARINDYGFIEAPYRKVFHSISFDSDEIVGRIIKKDIKVDSKTYKQGTVIDKDLAVKIKKAKLKDIDVIAYLSNEIIYYDVDEEFNLKISSLSVKIDEYGNILDSVIQIRSRGEYTLGSVDDVNHIEVSTSQIGGVSLNLIPFSAGNKADRTLMGSNMQKQAVPLVNPEAPLIGTGFESVVAENSNRAVFAYSDGIIEYADAGKVIVKYDKGEKETYYVDKFVPTNKKTSFSQTALLKKGNKVSKGDIIVDGPGMDHGELALGRNLVVGYMMYEGYNYEDGIVISERLIKEDLLTSVHVQSYTQDIKETRLGNEIHTRDIPNVSLHSLRNLDEQGIVRIGAYVESGDILVGIVAPKGEVELTAEEKLLRSIFGDVAKDVRDNSLRIPNGEKGIVIDVEILERSDDSNKLNPGVIKQIKVWVARTHKVGLGDKLSGRFGDKGVVSKILPVEDMPYLKDGTPIDIILSPSSITKRLNFGQLNEIYYGEIAKRAGLNFAFPIFSRMDEDKLESIKKKYDVGEIEDKVLLRDGRNSELFENKVSVGPRYILMLDHLADTKVTARSTGHYTVVNQQPLGGKAQMGGQRFGEMEVWALEAYGAASTLQEMLSIKSDDIIGRSEAYKSIIQNKKIQMVGIPESFKVLLLELKSLALNIEPIDVVVESTPEEVAEESVLPEDVFIENDEEVNAVLNDSSVESLEEE
ncbi:MAG: DNA-directed RNA polymerase subunit beta [Patescibacteria group bacterium]